MAKLFVLRTFLMTVFIACLLAGSNVLRAQETPPKDGCGYTGMSPWLEWYHNNKHLFVSERGADTTVLYVPLTLYIVGNDDGGGYFPLDMALRAVCAMNRNFEQVRIQFYLYPGDGVRYLNNSDWFEHTWSGGQEMITSNRIDGRLNCFIVQDPAGNCGYSWLDAIVLNKSCSGAENTTWAHEAGHHFSLPHTFYGWENTVPDFNEPAPATISGVPVEKIDSSNCAFAADRFCDTRPDYLSYRWSCLSNSQSEVIQHDPNDKPFRSNGRLIMSYASDQCMDLFSNEQIAAMRANLTFEHADYLQVFQAQPGIPEDTIVQLIAPIDSAAVQFDDIDLKWAPIPNAQYYAVEASIFPNFGINIFQGVTNNTSIAVNAFIPTNRLVYWRVRAYSDWSLCDPILTPQRGIFRTKNLTATNELERHAVAQLVPNPASGSSIAQLRINSDESMEAQLTLHDAAGRLCYQQQMRILNGENAIDIPITQLESGLYTVTLVNELGRMVLRLAVVN